MKKEKSSNQSFWISIMSAPIVVAVILLTVYYIKGIYPFGSGNISYFDMAQSLVPIYYHTYDVLHGSKAVFWDWYSGTGVSMIDTAGNFIFSPFNLFFLFVKRDNILEAMSFFLMLKVCACAGTMSFYFKKTYPELKCVWHILAGVLYSSCGFVVQYYSNIHFLDIVALFPIIIYFTNKLLQEKDIAGYCIFMAMGFVINIYLMFQVSIYLIVYCTGKIRRMEKSIRKSAAALLGGGTLIAGCISAIISVPTVLALLHSSRADVSNDMLSGFKYAALINYTYENKVFMLYGCELPIAILIVFILMRRKEVKKLLPTVYLFILMILPVFFELINLLWHVGGYVEFPMRFGYMLSFTGLVLMGEILQIEEQEPDVKPVKQIVSFWRLPAVAAIPFVAITLYYFIRMFLKCGIRDTTVYGAYEGMLLILLIVYGMAVFSKSKNSIVMVCICVVLLQAGMGWYGFLAPEDMYVPECADSIVKNSENLKELFENDTYKEINRIKDESVSLNTNYPFILQKASVSNWTLGAKPEVRQAISKMGYSSAYTRIIDNGGTLFSDALLNIRDIVSISRPDERLYEVKGEKSGYYVASMKYVYPFGILVSDNMLEWSETEESSALAYQNGLFRAMDGREQDLIFVYNQEDILKSQVYNEEKEIYQYCFEIPVKQESVLYLQADDVSNMYVFWLNGRVLSIPALGDEDNVVYPAYFVNGLLNCGVYEEEVVECMIECVNPIEEESVVFGGLDLTILRESMETQNEVERVMTVGKKSLRIELQNASSKYILLPIGFDGNQKIKVNGKKVTPLAAVEGAFYLVPLENDWNVIEISFLPSGMALGTLISGLGVIGLVTFSVFKERATNNICMRNVMYFLLMLCEKCIVLVLYILPILYSVFRMIKLQLFIHGIR